MNFNSVLQRASLGLVALAIAQPSLAQDASLLMNEGADRAQKLITAAKKEGTFTFYTSIVAKDIQPSIGPFENKYGIRVRLWRAGNPHERISS